MRSLSSTLSDRPSRWEPSRSVVSKTSTSTDMFDPVLVPVNLAAHRGKEDLLDTAGHRPGLPGADHAVVDGTDGHDLGRGAGQEGLVRRVEVAAEDVAGLDLDAFVARDGEHRALRDPLECACRDGRRDDAAVLDHEDVLPGALADIALW